MNFINIIVKFKVLDKIPQEDLIKYTKIINIISPKLDITHNITQIFFEKITLSIVDVWI